MKKEEKVDPIVGHRSFQARDRLLLVARILMHPEVHHDEVLKKIDEEKFTQDISRRQMDYQVITYESKEIISLYRLIQILAHRKLGCPGAEIAFKLGKYIAIHEEAFYQGCLELLNLMQEKALIGPDFEYWWIKNKLQEKDFEPWKPVLQPKLPTHRLGEQPMLTDPHADNDLAISSSDSPEEIALKEKILATRRKKRLAKMYTNYHIVLVAKNDFMEDWVKSQGFPVNQVVNKLKTSEITELTIVIGHLSVDQAAYICGSRAQYMHISFEDTVNHICPNCHHFENLNKFKSFKPKIVKYKVERR